MKRSEMVLDLSGELSALLQLPTGYTMKVADIILDRLERRGMLPPTLQDKGFTMSEKGEMTYQVNEWEKE